MVTSELFKTLHIIPILIANNDVSGFEIEICSNLPPDYIQFISQFGEGIIGDYIRIFPLAKLCQATDDWKEGGNFWAEQEFFNKCAKDETLIVGDALDGDLIFYLNEKFYLTARQYEEKGLHVRWNT
jgi:hypothetical protein